MAFQQPISSSPGSMLVIPTCPAGLNARWMDFVTLERAGHTGGTALRKHKERSASAAQGSAVCDLLGRAG